MRTRLLTCLTILATVAVAAAEMADRGAPVGKDGVISAVNLGEHEVWPLKIARGTFVCDKDAVFISDGTTAYPLNGAAKALMRQDPKGRAPLEDIWLVDEKTLAGLKASGVKAETIRFDISPVLRRGVDWCRVRVRR
jgi:hypothetical protein